MIPHPNGHVFAFPSPRPPSLPTIPIMSMLSSIPVLQGRGGAVLTAEPGGLVLTRPREELSIPERAVARVRAEGRSVTVELRVPAGGAATAAHRIGIEDVSEAAATAFADAVNGLLEDPAADTEDVDGAALVVLRTIRTLWRERFMRRLKWLVIGSVGTLVALSVVTGIAGGAVYPVMIVVFGGIGTAGLWIGAYLVGTWLHERRLLKHGITVLAAPATMSGLYLYVDTDGLTRTVSHLGGAPFLQVSYDPRDPADVLVPQTPFMRRLDVTVGGFILFCSLNAVAMVGFAVVDAFTGGTLTGDGV